VQDYVGVTVLVHPVEVPG